MQERKEYIEELVFGYLAGDLNEEEKKDLLTWLEADEVNKKSFSEMADSWATVMSLFLSRTGKAILKRTLAI